MVALFLFNFATLASAAAAMKLSRRQIDTRTYIQKWLRHYFECASKLTKDL